MALDLLRTMVSVTGGRPDKQQSAQPFKVIVRTSLRLGGECFPDVTRSRKSSKVVPASGVGNDRGTFTSFLVVLRAPKSQCARAATTIASPEAVLPVRKVARAYVDEGERNYRQVAERLVHGHGGITTIAVIEDHCNNLAGQSE